MTGRDRAERSAYGQGTVRMGKHLLLPRSEYPGQNMLMMMFPNGYGASVVRNWASAGSADGLWELAVIVPPADATYPFDLCYSSPITDDVLGRLTEEDVSETLDRIEALPDNGMSWKRREPA